MAPPVGGGVACHQKLQVGCLSDLVKQPKQLQKKITPRTSIGGQNAAKRSVFRGPSKSESGDHGAGAGLEGAQGTGATDDEATGDEAPSLHEPDVDERA